MAETPGTDFSQIKSIDRHGSGAQAQSSDGTGVVNHLAGFLDGGTLTDAGVALADLATVAGGGAIWTGQVPNGTVDGANTHFTLDYKLASPITILQIGTVQQPGVEADGAGGYRPVANGEYTVALGENTLTSQHAPLPGQKFYIWYFRGEAASSLATHVALTTTTAFAQNVSPGGGQAAQSLYGEGLPFFGHLAFQYDDASYAKRTQTYDITDPLDLVSPRTALGRESLKVYFFTDNGTRFTTWSPGDFLDVYDVFLTVTWADASTTAFRPTAYGVDTYSNLAHMVEDPPNWSSGYAIDGDSNTAARYNRTVGGSFLSTTTGFWVGGWVRVGGAPAPTPVPQAPGGVKTEAGSYQATPTDTGTLLNFTSAGASTLTLPPQVDAPAAPTLSSVTGGTLAAATRYATVTYTNASGETAASPEASLAVTANHLLSIASPLAATGATGYNVYVSSATGGETKQNFAPIPLGTNWTEATTGLLAAGTLAPTVNTASPSSAFTVDVTNSGTGTVTLTPPTGTTITGGTTLAAGQSATIRSDGSSHYYVTITGTDPGAATHTELLTDSSGPITSGGDFIYVTGVPG